MCIFPRGTRRSDEYCPYVSGTNDEHGDTWDYCRFLERPKLISIADMMVVLDEAWELDGACRAQLTYSFVLLSMKNHAYRSGCW